MRFVITHEWMGHLTHLEGESVIFPLMLLVAKRSGYSPRHLHGDANYGLRNMSEFWAVTHESPYTNARGHLEQFPLMMALAAAVYTKGGDRFDPRSLRRVQDLGFSLTIGES